MDEVGKDEGHPGIEDLEAFRTGEAADEVRRHVEQCGRCRALLGELENIRSEIMADKAPAALWVPPEVDTAVLSMMRTRAADVRRLRRGVAVARWVTLAAAAVILAVGLPVILLRDHRAVRETAAAGSTRQAEAPEPSGLAAATHRDDTFDPGRRMDIDGSGKVDIIDAYRMALVVRDKGEPPTGWDFNDDGAVDWTDVDAVAMRAVSVSREEG